MRQVEISLIIPTLRSWDKLSALVASIGRQNFELKNLEVLIVSNTADPSYSEISDTARTRPFTLKHLVAPSKGVNYARNTGLEQAQGEILLFVDDDCLFKGKNFLTELVSLHQKNPMSTGIGGIYEPLAQASSIDRAYNLISRRWQAPKSFGSPEGRELVGGNVSYKNKKLKEYGLQFNPEITYGGAESEFHGRLRAAGAQLLCFDQLRMLHVPNLSVNQLVSKAYYQALGQQKFSTQQMDRRDKPDYQDPAVLWAANQCKSDEQLIDILVYLELYNWIFQQCQKQSNVSLRGMQKLGNRWLTTQSLSSSRGLQ